MAKRAAAAGLAKPDIVEHDSEELTLARTDGEVVSQFTANLRAFFGRATELESQAKTMLVQAKATPAPTNAAEDAQIQRDIQRANGHTKAIGEHWTICQVLSRLHKRTTSGRARGTDASEETARFLNALHQRYVDDANRKAREEADRLRREAEERARQDRAKELADLEAAAAKAEQASPELSEREEEFVMQFWGGKYAGNAFRCAGEAGYAQPRSAAERLMNSPKIQAALKAKEDARRAREQAAAVREQPVRVEATTTLVQPEVQKIAPERTTWSAEILDAAAFVDAVCEGRSGIPRDTLTPNQTKLNQYARDMRELMNRWVGVRANKTTKVL